MENFLLGFEVALAPHNLLFAGIGAVLGTAIGVLPGLGPPATIAMLLPLSYGMEPVSAVIMLAGIYYGAMYGGSITSILLNIPGEAGSVVTCLDGYRMARQGRAGAALGMSAIASFIAGTLSIVGLSLLSPLLAQFALRFGPPEYFALILLGLYMAVYLSHGSIAKGLMMGALGLLIGCVGLDPVNGVPRYTFGQLRLMDGFDFVVVAMGLFGIAEVLSNLDTPEQRAVLGARIKGLLPNREDWRRSYGPVARGSLIGFLVGVLPGGGATISSFVAYGVEKRISKKPEAFGTGAIEGVASPEAANNAASTSSFIPLLTLGIPGNASIAMILVALMIHGIRPGPQMISEHPDIFWGVAASMYVGNLMLLALNLPLVGIWVKLLKVPYHYLAPLIVVICIIGAYSVHYAVFDVGLMIFFGIVGYFMRKADLPPAPLILAMILGPMLERSLQQSLLTSGGDPMIFVQHPISATLLAATAIIVLMPLFGIFRRFRNTALREDGAAASTEGTD
jgi:putative tricarboxylic transport membrane protein